MIGPDILIHIGRGIAWVAENFPDDPRLGRRLLLGGGALLAAFWFLAHSSRWVDSTFGFQLFCLIAGVISFFLGFFVFFRRAVWRNQERQGSGLTSLNLTQRNNSSPKPVSVFDVRSSVLDDESFD